MMESYMELKKIENFKIRLLSFFKTHITEI